MVYVFGGAEKTGDVHGEHAWGEWHGLLLLAEVMCS
jgi:hypothetical protein